METETAAAPGGGERGPREGFIRDEARETRQVTAEDLARHMHDQGQEKKTLRYLEIATAIARETLK